MQKSEIWTIAYRKRVDGQDLLDNTQRAFKVLPNTWRYWRADPFLFEYDGKTYLFAEMYDRLLRRGVIGYCELRDDGCTSWQVALSLPFHLSYPFVFEQDGQVYMIPESYVANEIGLYKAVEFPHRWEKVKSVATNLCAVDTTLFELNSQRWLMTLQNIDGNEVLTLSKTDSELNAEALIKVGENGNVQVRPGGRLYIKGEKLIRPAQDCSSSYGCALNFYEVTTVSENCFFENLICKLSPDVINNNLDVKPQGIHTYNFSSDYEVIDFKSYEKDVFAFPMRVIWALVRRIKGLLER